MPAYLSNGQIYIATQYNAALVEAIKTVPGRVWDSKDRVWKIPAKPYYARQVIDVLKPYRVEIKPDLQDLAAEKKAKNNLRAEDFRAVDGKMPYDYQLEAVDFADANGGRVINADDVGLGKTAEALMWLRYRKVGGVIVVCPASVTYKWRAEFNNWYPEIKHISILETGNKTWPADTEVIITSYDQMRIEVERLKTFRPNAVVFDECHRLKDYKSLRTKAAKDLARGVGYVFGLSGTPIKNRPNELYNLLNLLDPAAWNWNSFMRRYCFDGNTYQGSNNLAELEERLRSIMIRRMKRDVSDQMSKLTRTIVPMQVDQRTYMKLYTEDHKTWENLIGRVPKNQLDWLQGMRQWITHAKSDAALEWAEDFLNSSEEKLVVYCGFLDIVAKWEQALSSFGVSKIVGSVSQSDRQKVINDWQTSKRKRVMLLTSAGGEGIDLFGKNGIQCSTLLFVAREWSPADEMQVEGRLDRTGQEYPVQCVYLLAEGTLDIKINELIEKKRAILKQAIGIYTPDTSILPDLMKLKG